MKFVTRVASRSHPGNNFMKSFGPLEWVVDVGVGAVVAVDLCLLLLLVLVAFGRPK